MIEDLAEWLQEQGWREYSPNRIQECDRAWDKQVDIDVVCQLNEQLFIHLEGFNQEKYLDNPNHGNEWKFELDIRAEPINGTWVELKVYGITMRDLKEQLQVQERKLIKAWRACNT